MLHLEFSNGYMIPMATSLELSLVEITRNSVRTFTYVKITRKRTYGFWITYVNSGLPDEECKEFRRLDRWSESKAAASGRRSELSMRSPEKVIESLLMNVQKEKREPCGSAMKALHLWGSEGNAKKMALPSLLSL